MSSIVWFRRDLRLSDNPALTKALSLKEPIILLYIQDQEINSNWPIGSASKWWLHHSLIELQTNIKSLNGFLNIVEGDPKKILLEITEKYKVKNIFWNRLYEPETILRDSEIKSTMTENNISCESFNGSLLIEPWEIKTTTGGPYQVFSPFWRALQRSYKSEKTLAKPKSLSESIELNKSTKVESLNLLPKINWDKEFEKLWTPGENGAVNLTKEFLKNKVTKYTLERDFPSISANSKLSPHLHFGEISPKKIWNMAEEAFNKSNITEIEPFIRQLGWRDFAHHLLFHFPHTIDKPLKPSFEKFPWSKNKKYLIAWQKGETGYPIIDAGMRELWQTGIMHNRVRMIVGSFLVKNLLLHWSSGAKWFWDTLLDADLANNTMGWQWVAGSGADAAPYFRIFNPVSQSQKFDSEGIYLRKWLPELAKLPNKYIHAPWEAPGILIASAGIKLGKDYPKPIVDLKTTRENALEAYYSISKKS